MNIDDDILAAAYQAVVEFLRDCRSRQKAAAAQWKRLRETLAVMGIPSEECNAIQIWSVVNLDEHDPGSVARRVLAPPEQALLSRESYGLLLEALQQGMISTVQAEILLEEIPGEISIPVTPAAMQIRLARIWVQGLDRVGHHLAS